MKVPKLDSSFDFEAVANSKGYLKARLILKQLTADSKQKDITNAEKNDPLLSIRERLKAQNDLKISRTIGLTSSESHLEKILSLAKKDRNVPSERNGPNGECSVSVSTADTEGTIDSTFHRSLLSEEGSLFFANTGLECLPIEFGDTLALQTAFVKSIMCPGNNFRYLTPKQIPQLSVYHLRYVRDINLSNNKLKSMPSEIGNMKSLQTMDLSGNLLSSLPASIINLKELNYLNISNNAFNTLPPEFAEQISLTRLNISSNAMSAIPPCIVKLIKLKTLDLSKNYLQHLAVMPLSLLQPKDLWKRMLSEESGKFVYFHMLTKETVERISSYNGQGIALSDDLHIFQPLGTISYNRRKMWLSVNKIFEWEPLVDESTTWIYYRNNVSGETQW